MGASCEVGEQFRPVSFVENFCTLSVVGMMVTQYDGINTLRIDANLTQSPLHLAPTKSAINEHLRLVSLQQRSIAAAARTEVCNLHCHPELSEGGLYTL